jgi:uncharacterized protein YdeI (YjbR/CyaY-like superfamily)
MPARDPRFDAYIEKAGDFAQPILVRLREIVHAACPDVEEALKWSCPHFTHHGMLCSMAAFKAHCSFGFWNHALVAEHGGPAIATALKKCDRIESEADLPPKKVLVAAIKVAMRLNDEGVKAVRPKKAKPELVTPDDLTAALKKNKKARAAFDAFSPSHKREYVEWITEAKREETRRSRVETAVEWMAEGKSRHWKYAKC